MIIANLAIFGTGDPVWVVTFEGICAMPMSIPPDQSLPACPITTEHRIIGTTDPTRNQMSWTSRTTLETSPSPSS